MLIDHKVSKVDSCSVWSLHPKQKLTIRNIVFLQVVSLGNLKNKNGAFRQLTDRCVNLRFLNAINKHSWLRHLWAATFEDGKHWLLESYTNEWYNLVCSFLHNSDIEEGMCKTVMNVWIEQIWSRTVNTTEELKLQVSTIKLEKEKVINVHS